MKRHALQRLAVSCATAFVLCGPGCAGSSATGPRAVLDRAWAGMGPSPSAETCRRFRAVLVEAPGLFWEAVRGYVRCRALRGELALARRDLQHLGRRFTWPRRSYAEGFVLLSEGPTHFDEARRAFVRAHEGEAGAWEPAYRLGLMALAGGQLDEAARWLGRALERSPQGRVRIALARVFVLQGRFEEACAQMRLAAEREASTRLGYRAQRVALLLEHVAAKSSARALALAKRAGRYLDQDLPGMAVQILGPVADLEDPTLLLLAGRANLRLGNDARAAAAFRKALARNPYAFEAATALGRLLLDAHRAAEAVRMLERAVAVAPFSPDAQSSLAVALGKVGRWERAADSWRVAHALRGDRSSLAGWVGALRRSGRLREAVGVLTAWLRTHGRDVRAWLLLGDVSMALYRKAEVDRAEAYYAKAVSAYRRVLELEPGNLEAIGRLRELGVTPKLP